MPLDCCDCIYTNHCESNAGLGLSACCCSLWLCSPSDLSYFRGGEGPGCGCWQGIGYNLFCWGYVVFVPDFIRKFSMRREIGDYRGNLYDVNII